MRVVSVAWRAPFNKVEPTVAKEIIDQLEERDGAVVPAAMVEVARDPQNALHGEFEWDDPTAANEWREEQARKLIANLLVVYRRDGTNEIAGPIRYAIPERRVISDAPTKRYITMRKQRAPTLEDELREAQQRLLDWIDRYEHLEALGGVINAIMLQLNGQVVEE